MWNGYCFHFDTVCVLCECVLCVSVCMTVGGSEAFVALNFVTTTLVLHSSGGLDRDVCVSFLFMTFPRRPDVEPPLL